MIIYLVCGLISVILLVSLWLKDFNRISLGDLLVFLITFSAGYYALISVTIFLLIIHSDKITIYKKG